MNLAIAKHFKQNLKLLLDVNGFRERRKKMIVAMAKRLAEKVKNEGKPASTKPLNPYERRIVHTLFKNNNRITTHSEGDGHMKKVIIAPAPAGRRACRRKAVSADRSQMKTGHGRHHLRHILGRGHGGHRRAPHERTCRPRDP